jgi:hypothetical protein
MSEIKCFSKKTLTIFTGLGPSDFTQASLKIVFFKYIYLNKIEIF